MRLPRHLTAKATFAAIAMALFFVRYADARPSLSKHEQQISQLEIKTQLIKSELVINKELITKNAILIETNKQNLTQQQGKEGPQGPEGPPGPQGPPGPAGSDGELSDLGCEVGQTPVWDSREWICSSSNDDDYPEITDACISGFLFDAKNGLTGDDSNWNVICDHGDLPSGIWGPFTESQNSVGGYYSPTSFLAHNVADLNIDFSGPDGGIVEDPIKIEFSPIEIGNNQGITLRVTSLEPNVNQELKDWAAAGSADWQFSFEEQASGTRVELSGCKALSLIIKPRRTSESVVVEHRVELRCVVIETIDSHSHRLVEGILLNHFGLAESGLPDFFYTEFHEVVGILMGQFDKQVSNITFTHYQLPSITKIDDFQDLERWQLGPHSLQFMRQATPNLPL